MSRTSLLKIFRVTHLYFGVFIAPALLFFAFTGAVQSLGLHETNREHPNYKPAHWIETLAQIHKKQTDVLPVRRSRPKADTGAAALPGPAANDPAAHIHHGQPEAAGSAPVAGPQTESQTESWSPAQGPPPQQPHPSRPLLPAFRARFPCVFSSSSSAWAWFRPPSPASICPTSTCVIDGL